MAKRSSIVAALVAALVAVAIATSCSSSSKRPPPSDVTFVKDIEPIVRDKCETCHREGGIAPFALNSYEQVSQLGAAAKEKVARREMPPWGAFDDDACTVERKFKDNLSLTQDQVDTFVRWVDQGMARGDPAQAAPAAASTYAPVGLQNKTVSYEVASSYAVPAGANDDFRCFVIDPGLEEDAWVAESIVVPGDPKVVHHALVYIDQEREGIVKSNGTDSYPCFGGPDLKQLSLVLAWSPGGVSTSYGENAALRIPKGSHLVMQVHYHPLATQTTGRMNIELRTLPERPERVAGFVLLGNAESPDTGFVRLLPGPNDPPGGPVFLIPSNAKNHVESMELVIPDDVREARVSTVGAHMHWAGVGMRLQVHRKAPLPGEQTSECLLNVTKYDFNWQRTYAYDSPLTKLPALRAGDKVRISCIYDNTKDNPHVARLMKEQRRTKPADIRLGSDSLDEMCQAMIVLLD
jgi:hypothetical protein